MRSIEEVVRQFKHICWYPSAGNDFRALLFLSEWYYKEKHVPHDSAQNFPDLFILTDYQGLGDSSKIDIYEYKSGDLLFDDGRTEIVVEGFEPLQKLTLSYDPNLTTFNRTSAYNSVLLFTVEVKSKLGGNNNSYKSSILYVTVQNESFANELILPNKISIEYLVLVRYGTGFGCAQNGPSWIIDELINLGVEYLISNKEYVTDYLQDYCSDTIIAQFDEFYSIDGKQWSDYGEVGWYKV